MAVFFHETLDPLPQPGAHTRYLDELGEVVRREGNAKGSAGGRCIAVWAPLFLTGRWPQIVTFWEAPGGWEGFGAHFDATPDLFHAPLERWYGERSGGFDRMLVGAGAPDLDTLVAEKRRAPVVLQETIRLEPGAAGEYLGLLQEAAPEVAAGGGGVELIGGYEVAFRRGGEALVLWAFESFAALARAQDDAADAAPGLAAWATRAAGLEIESTGLVLRPTTWSPLR
jgi:hypothetical protein